MFCTNCGAQIEDGLNFCTNCGSPVEQPMPAPAAPAPAPAPAPQPVPAAAPMPQPAPQPVQQQPQPVMLDPLAPASVPLSQVGGETSPSICTRNLAEHLHLPQLRRQGARQRAARQLHGQHHLWQMRP